MGYYKNLQIELEGRGYGQSDKYLCANCIHDNDLKKWINDSLELQKQTVCSYCKKKKKCISLEDLVGRIIERISEDYDNPDNIGVYYDDESDSYCAPIYDTDEIIAEYLYEDDEIMEDIAGLINNDCWCGKEPYRLTESERWMYSWEHFSNVVKYKNRYLFFTEKTDELSEYMSPLEILEMLNKQAIEFDLIDVLPPGEFFYRAQYISSNKIEALTGKRLGSPPAKKAKANRMSAEGISVFYGADNEKTAIKEAAYDINDKEKQDSIKDKKLVVARFQNLEEINFLNLCKIDKLICPGLFDNNEGAQKKRKLIIFLQSLNKELSKPIEQLKGIEYAPTQVLAEYFKNIAKINGIKYNSAKDKGCGCFVLFYDNEQCADGNAKPLWIKNQKLKLIDYKIF